MAYLSARRQRSDSCAALNFIVMFPVFSKVETMMKIILACLALPALLAACAAPPADTVSSTRVTPRHITPHECQDLAALRQGAAPTPPLLTSEVSVLLTAGYNEVTDADIYPGALHPAQRRVNYWYSKDCAM